MASPRDPVDELMREVSVARGGSQNIGPLILEHAEVLAARLHVPLVELHRLSQLYDVAICEALRAPLRRLRDDRRDARTSSALSAAATAAQALGVGARRTDEGFALSVDVLLSPRLSSSVIDFVVFEARDFTTATSARVLSTVRRELPHFDDLRAFVDARGLHLRWHRNRGGLNFLSQPITPSARSVHVALGAVATVGSTRPPVHRPPFPIADVLADIGFVF